MIQIGGVEFWMWIVNDVSKIITTWVGTGHLPYLNAVLVFETKHRALSKATRSEEAYLGLRLFPERSTMLRVKSYQSPMKFDTELVKRKVSFLKRYGRADLGYSQARLTYSLGPLETDILLPSVEGHDQRKVTMPCVLPQQRSRMGNHDCQNVRGLSFKGRPRSSCRLYIGDGFRF